MIGIITFVMAILMVMLVVKIINLQENERILKDCMFVLKIEKELEERGEKLVIMKLRNEDYDYILDVDVFEHR